MSFVWASQKRFGSPRRRSAVAGRAQDAGEGRLVFRLIAPAVAPGRRAGQGDADLAQEVEDELAGQLAEARVEVDVEDVALALLLRGGQARQGRAQQGLRLGDAPAEKAGDLRVLQEDRIRTHRGGR